MQEQRALLERRAAKAERLKQKEHFEHQEPLPSQQPDADPQQQHQLVTTAPLLPASRSILTEIPEASSGMTKWQSSMSMPRLSLPVPRKSCTGSVLPPRVFKRSTEVAVLDGSVVARCESEHREPSKSLATRTYPPPPPDKPRVFRRPSNQPGPVAAGAVPAHAPMPAVDAVRAQLDDEQAKLQLKRDAREARRLARLFEMAEATQPSTPPDLPQTIKTRGRQMSDVI